MPSIFLYSPGHYRLLIPFPVRGNSHTLFLPLTLFVVAHSFHILQNVSFFIKILNLLASFFLTTHIFGFFCIILFASIVGHNARGNPVPFHYYYFALRDHFYLYNDFFSMGRTITITKIKFKIK